MNRDLACPYTPDHASQSVPALQLVSMVAELVGSEPGGRWVDGWQWNERTPRFCFRRGAWSWSLRARRESHVHVTWEGTTPCRCLVHIQG